MTTPTPNDFDWSRGIGSRLAGVTIPELREDAAQEACVAVLEAARCYRPEMETPFRAYCKPWVVNRVMALVRKWRWRRGPSMTGRRFREYHNARPRFTVDDDAVRAVDARDVIEAVGRRFGATCERAVRACWPRNGVTRQAMHQRRAKVRPLVVALLAKGDAAR